MAKSNRARTSVKRKKRAVRKSPRPKGRPKAKAAASQSRGKWVYGFGDGRAEGTASMRNLLGGKGAGLAEMANLKLPVPPGFTITTDVCTYYYRHNKQYPKDLRDQVEKALAQVGRITGRKFGDETNPLLVSVRSVARASISVSTTKPLRRSQRNQAIGASPTTAIAVSSLCIPMWCSALATNISKSCSTGTRNSRAIPSIRTCLLTIGPISSFGTRSA